MSSMWEIDDDGKEHLLLDNYEWIPLDETKTEARFFVLHPCPEDRDPADEYNHVRGEMHVQSLDDADPYIAISNARGYKMWNLPIEVDGAVMYVPLALDTFLRHFRHKDRPVRIWTRYLCLNLRSLSEQKHYWTRPFVERMYAGATQVVDMHAFVGGLLDTKIITPYVNTYELREKAQNAGDELRWRRRPEVYPIVLGTTPTEDLFAESDTFRYVPLDRVADEIRLTVTEMSEDETAPLKIRLGHLPLTSDIPYSALSYTWGDSEEEIAIYCSGQRLMIRPNLAQALRDLRLKKYLHVLWVDAISIDQKNQKERIEQVARMGDIYRYASSVISYLGDDDEDTEVVRNNIDEFRAPLIHFGDNGGWQLHSGEKNGEQLVSLCTSMLRFFHRPYFTRVWVLQEVAFPEDPYLVCGTATRIAWVTLDHAVYNFADLLKRDSLTTGHVVQKVPEIDNIFEILASVRKLFYFRKFHQADEFLDILMQPPPQRSTSPGYLDCLILTRSCEATVAHDKIYALWNLARDKENLQVELDYSKSVHETYIDFTKAWAKQKGQLDMIAASEFSGRYEDVFYEKAPTWCPDWSRPPLTSSIVRRDWIPSQIMRFVWDIGGELYSADGGMRQPEPGTFFSFDADNVIHCTGIIFDSIYYITKTPPPLKDEPKHLQGYLRMWHILNKDRTRMREVYRDLKATKYDDFDQAFVAMMCGDNAEAWCIPEEEEGSTFTHEAHTDEPDVNRWAPRTFTSWQLREQPPPANESRYLPQWATGYRDIDRSETMETVLRGKDLVLTQGGYMGLVPSFLVPSRWSKAKIELAILATCSVPVVLQEVEDAPGTYRFLGSCFVQGWMNGEMVTDYMGADSPEEFWESVKDDCKIKII